MSVFKNIKDIKLSQNDNNEAKTFYLKNVKNKIENLLDEISANEDDIYHFFPDNADDMRDIYGIDLGSCLTEVYQLGHISYVKDIRYTNNNNIEVIFGVKPMISRAVNDKIVLELTRSLHYNLRNMINFFKYIFSEKIRSKLLGLKKSIYSFSFKIDISEINMFNVIHLPVSGGTWSGALLNGFEVEFIDICDIIEKYFINYSKFSNMIYLSMWHYEDLDILSHLGKIVKSRKIVIPDFVPLDGVGRLIPGLKHIAVPGAIVYIDNILITHISDIKEVNKQYEVVYDYISYTSSLRNML